METQQKTVGEVLAYWSQFHDKDELLNEDFDDNIIGKLCIRIALEMQEDPKLNILPIAIMNGFDAEDVEKIMNVTNSYTKLAEQIHLYFLGKEDKLEELLRLLKILNEDKE